MSLDEKLASVRQVIERCVDEASAIGVVVTVEQRPCKPLAMGNYSCVVSVRPARGHY